MTQITKEEYLEFLQFKKQKSQINQNYEDWKDILHKNIGLLKYLEEMKKKIEELENSNELLQFQLNQQTKNLEESNDFINIQYKTIQYLEDKVAENPIPSNPSKLKSIFQRFLK
jgi:DNA integrity scanning protein DisA with diadenylate cyclase activity